VSWLSRIDHECRTNCHGTPARNARIVATEAVPPRRGIETGSPKYGISMSPRSQVQTGRVQNYALGIAVGLIVMAGSYLLLAAR
jgi:hypothetical protein